VFERPEHKDRFAIDVFARYEAPGAAIVGGDAMIAEDKILVGRYDSVGIRAVVTIFERDVVFFEPLAVDDDVTVFHFHGIAR
jgi:hypothetical protein